MKNRGSSMLAYYWPRGILVLSNIFYHITAKSIPVKMDSFAAMTVSYIVSALISAILFFTIGKGGNIVGEITANANWASFVLGITMVGLEVGAIFMYKVGWNVNTGNVVQAILVAIALLFVGYLLYKEAITFNKVAGIIICLVGLYFINKS